MTKVQALNELGRTARANLAYSGQSDIAGAISGVGFGGGRGGSNGGAVDISL
jgi:hypothetical protein